MIKLQVDDASLKSVRLAFSPLWEAIGSLGILARYRGEAPSPYTAWARAVRVGMPEELMSDLVEAMRTQDLKLPDFITLPDPSRNSIEADLDYVRTVNGDLPRVDRLISLLQGYWYWSIAPYWNSIRSSLEEEILFRGRTLAVDGPEAMLGELGGRVMWSHPLLTAPYHRDVKLAVTEAQLLLVPTVFAGGIRLLMEDRGAVAMSYQARATGHFHVLTARVPDRKVEDRLTLLLGKGRAQVVRALEVPQTTTALSEVLGFAKSTVSQHLAVLANSGIVWKQRVGGQVFYRLDQSGLVLLRELGNSKEGCASRPPRPTGSRSAPDRGSRYR